MIADLMRGLLADMPTESGAVLARACNRALAGLPDRGMIVTQVAAFEMDDGR